MTPFRRGSLAGHRERGATSVLVIVLLVPVLFGAVALSVDVGALMWERHQLQNGADAAVASAARACAKDLATCSPSAVGLTGLAGLNANDGVSTVQSICANAAARAQSVSLAAAAGLVAAAAPPTGEVDLTVTGLRSAEGVVVVGLTRDADRFPKCDSRSSFR